MNNQVAEEKVTLTPAQMKFKLEMEEEIKRMVWEAVQELFDSAHRATGEQESLRVDLRDNIIGNLVSNYDLQNALPRSYTFRQKLIQEITNTGELDAVIKDVVLNQMMKN